MQALKILCLFSLAVTTLVAQQKLNLSQAESNALYKTYDDLRPKWPAQEGEGVVCLWKDGKLSALSVTIDDNNAGDIPFWRSMSEKYGWKFTWFLIVHPYMHDIHNDQPGSNTSYFGTPEVWKPVAAEGHEIGLHGACKEMNHLPPDEYRVHIQLTKEYLETNLGVPVMTYAYPCGATGPEGVYQSVVAESLIAARGTSGGPTPVQVGDYLNTKSMGSVTAPFSGQTAKRFGMLRNDGRPWKYSYYRGWPVFLYHHVKEPAQKKIDAALAEIKANEDLYWVAPFGEVARYAQERDTARIEVAAASKDEIRFTVTDQMKDGIFNVPLTIKFKVDGWSGAAARQNGEVRAARIVEHEGANYVLVDAVPDAGEVIVRPMGG